MSMDIYQEITSKLPQLTRHEKTELFNLLKDQLEPAAPRNRVSLCGIWEGRVPAEFDPDAALAEMRHEWEKKLADIDDA